MKRRQCSTSSFDWTLCCICQNNGDLRSTRDGIEKLSTNLLKHWEDEVLDFEPNKLTHKVTDGKADFLGSMLADNAKYHHDCASNYSEYKRNRKRKSLDKKLAQIQTQTSIGPSLRDSNSHQIDNYEVCIMWKNRQHRKFLCCWSLS